MQSQSIQLSNVIYNAASQCFEALVTIRDGMTIRRYACAADAPITMGFADAAAALRKQALRQHKHQVGLASLITDPALAPRAGRVQPDQHCNARSTPMRSNKREAA